MAEHDLTFRRLALLTRDADPSGKGLTHGYLGALARGEEDSPSLKAIELISRGAGVEPGYFAEYRLAMVRRRFDEREIGLDEALSALAELEGAAAGLEALAEEGERRFGEPDAEEDGDATNEEGARGPSRPPA